MKLNLTILLLAFSLALNATMNISGKWEGFYITEKGHKYSLKLSFHQINDSIFGTATTNEQAYTLNGKILSSHDSLIIEARHTTTGRLYYAYAGILNTDSIRFLYYSKDSSYYGFGAIKRVSQTRTLKLNYNYTGKHQLSDSIPLRIGLYATPVVESEPFYKLPVIQKSGTLYLTGIDSSIFYLLIYTGYNEDANRFVDMPVSYTTYKMPVPEQDWDSIVINNGEVKEIDFSLDDSNLYPQPAHFKGGKLPYLKSVPVNYVPFSIATDFKGNVYVSDENYFFKYTPNMAQFVDTVRDGSGKPIKGSKICFGPRNTFYVWLPLSGVKFYNNNGVVISSYANSYSYYADIALAADSNLIFCSRSRVVKFTDSLKSNLYIPLSQIVADHDKGNTDADIWSVAGRKNGEIAISLDYHNDEEGIDAVVFYNNDLSTYKSQIGGDWLNNGPHSIAFDTLGRTYILNYYHDELISVDLNSVPFQASYYKDTPGKNNGAMQRPADLAIFGSTIYVAEDTNKRVSIFNYKCRIEKFDTVTICEGAQYKGHTVGGSYVEILESVAGCDSVVTTLLKVNPVYNIEENKSICQGSTYKGHTTSGVYIETLSTVSGCDSVVTLNLKVNPIYNYTVNKTICQGEIYKGHNTTGIYTENLTTVAGCDSIVNIDLTVTSKFTVEENKSICQGQTYKGHVASGIYVDSLVAVGGCDSIFTLNLKVNPVYNLTENKAICEGETYKGHDATGVYNLTLMTVAGCDSTVQLHLTVNPKFSIEESKTICEGNSYKGHQSTGIFVDSLVSSSGCDSLINLNLKVNPVYNLSENKSICEGEVYKGHNVAGTFVENLKTVVGCDSILTLNLTVKALPAAPVVSNDGIVLTSNVTDGNQWYSVENGLVKDSVYQHFYASQDGGYFARVTADGCLSDSSNVLHVSKTAVEVVKNNNVELFPMPVEQYLNINSESIIDKIEIYSISGQKQLLKSNIGQNNFSCDLAKLKSGVYTVSLFFKDAKNPVTRKFIKK